jgi:hypothetical protein
MDRSAFVSRLARFFTLVSGVVVAASCGGGGDGTTQPPGVVARVEVTAPTSTMQVGQNLQTTARYYDASSAQLTGRTISYGTSSASVATVSTTGLVSAVLPGSVTITATVDGVIGNLALTVTPVPVFFIAITPANPSVHIGETVMLAAQPQNATGQPLTGRTITWSSANVALATITQGGVVTGVTSGTVFIRATADGHTDSVSLRVRNLVSPTITGTSSTILEPGGTGALTGTNFGPTIADNEVLVNGAPATVVSASPTAITFTVPSKSQLPCTATGPVPVALVVAADTATATVQLKVATPRALAVGESHLFTTEADLLCNEYPGSGGKYLMTAFNYASSPSIQTSFRMVGSAQTGVAAAAASAQQLLAPAAPPGWSVPEDRMTRHLKAHSSFMQQERQLASKLGNPRLKERAIRRSRAAGAPLSFATVPPPAVGDNITYRVRSTITSVTTYDEISFRVVYSGTKIVILEDPASPLANTMDHEFERLGDEFDQVMYGLLLAFGDPLVVDSALDNNGRLLALFTPKVNGYTLNGQTNQILGFVQLCDFFPREPLTLPGGTVVPGCPASNEGEAFYALIPDPGAGWTIDFWRRIVRGTLIHEAKHIASYAWRYFFDASEIEETWLEEATAQQASEIWARSLYGRGAKQDIGWADGPHCDYAPVGGACPDPAEGILHHFGFLYDHYTSPETKSILDGTDAVIYGSSWSFIRYVTDAFATSEPSFLSAITQVQNDRGVANVASKSGHPFSELFGMFSLASVADNYPGATLTDPRLRLASWNSRDLFQNMSENLVTTGGSQAYPLPWPMQMRTVSFGNFTIGQSNVSQLKGGSFAVWELSGTQTSPQALAIRSLTGGPPPSQIGMAIVRIQ